MQLILIPHSFNHKREVLPVEEVAEAVELAFEYLEVIGVLCFFFVVDVESVLPSVELFIPVFLFINQDVLLRILEDTLRCLGLLQTVVSLNKEVNRPTRIVVEF